MSVKVMYRIPVCWEHKGKGKGKNKPWPNARNFDIVCSHIACYRKAKWFRWIEA